MLLLFGCEKYIVGRKIFQIRKRGDLIPPDVIPSYCVKWSFLTSKEYTYIRFTAYWTIQNDREDRATAIWRKCIYVGFSRDTKAFKNIRSITVRDLSPISYLPFRHCQCQVTKIENGINKNPLVKFLLALKIFSNKSSQRIKRKYK